MARSDLGGSTGRNAASLMVRCTGHPRRTGCIRASARCGTRARLYCGHRSGRCRVDETRARQSRNTRPRRGVGISCAPRLPGETRVLLIDERKYSQGIGAVATRNNRGAFERMIQAARAAHPNAEFWLARTRDRGSGMWLSASAADILPADIHRLGEHESLCAALEHVDHVYTVGASEECRRCWPAGECMCSARHTMPAGA